MDGGRNSAAEVTMSKQAVIDFLKKVDGDLGVLEKVDRALDDKGRAVELFLATAAEHGFQFTADEFFEAVQAEGIDEKSGELSDEDLEAVAGGLTFQSRRTRGMTSRAMKKFGSLRSGLGIRGIGGGGVMQEAQEEEESPQP
jgi:predicted ribosomally synthesized peptide with nif11-like leader